MSTMMGTRASDGRALQAVDQALDRIARTARPDVVFGQPIERGDTTIIPCCEIALGMGMGSGSGSNPTNPTRRDTGRDTGRETGREAAADQAASTAMGSGEGAGAGGGARGRPVAVIVIAPGSVRVEPVVDATRIALAALTTAGFMAFWVVRLVGALRAAPAAPAAVAMALPREAGGPWWARLPGMAGMAGR